MKLVGPQRAGIVDIDVDIAGRQRVEDHVGAEAFARSRGKTGRAQPLRDQRGQHILLGESLGADDIARWRARHRGTKVAATSAAMPTPPSARATAAVANAGLDQRQQLITASASTAAVTQPNSTNTQFWVCSPAKM